VRICWSGGIKVDQRDHEKQFVCVRAAQKAIGSNEMAYDNTNRGALFKNDKREKDTQPTHRGDINIDGEDYWLDAWVKTAQSGRQYFSLAVKKKDTRQGVSPQKPKQQEAKPAQPLAEMDDDIPF
jgi:hypothetical protein